MNLFFRGAIVYIFLLIIFRIMGKRSLAQVTTFDFILLLIIGEATQQALLGDDFSITNCLALITVLVGLDILFTVLKNHFKFFDKIIDGTPIIIVEDGKPLKVRMKKVDVDLEDILEAARSIHGITDLKEIRYAVLERDGNISIIPVEK